MASNNIPIFYSGNPVSTGANDVMPHGPVYNWGVVVEPGPTGPTGLTGSFFVEELCGNPADSSAVLQRATEISTGQQYVRYPTSVGPPPVWGPFILVGPGAAVGPGGATGATGALLVFNGSQWVPSNDTSGHSGFIQNLATSSIVPQGSTLNMKGQVNISTALASGFTGPIVLTVSTDATLAGNTGRAHVEFIDTNTGFNVPTASILLLAAQNSVSIGGGTNFLSCFNIGATGYTGVNPDGTVAQIQSNGTMRALAFTVWSSADAKEEIAELSLPSQMIRKLRPVSYRYKRHFGQGERHLGMLYEDVKEVAPLACHDCAGFVDEDGCPNPLSKGLDLGAVIAMQAAIIKDLERRVSELESGKGVAVVAAVGPQ